LFDFAFPLFGTQIFDALSLGVGNPLLAAVGIVMGMPCRSQFLSGSMENDSGHRAA